jgi:hypothetical protein
MQMQASGLRKKVRLVSICLIVLMLAAYTALVISRGATTFDDAYMFIRYASHILSGQGIAWNPDGIQTYGATSLLYLGLITILRGLLPHSVSAGALLTAASFCLGLGALAVLALTCAKLAGSRLLREHPLTLAAVLMGSVLVSKTFLYHATSGMDTTLSLLCNSLLILSTLGWLRSEKKSAFLPVVAAGYAAFLARPDNLIYAITFPVLCTLLLSRPDRKGRLARFLGGMLICLALDTLAKWLLFGDPLPLPFYAKLSGYYDGYAGAVKWNPAVYLFDFGRLALPFLLAIFVLPLTRESRRLVLACLLPVAITFLYYFSVLQIMGFRARFYFPALPFVVVAGFAALDQFLSAGCVWRLRSGRLVLASALVLILLVPSIGVACADGYARLFIPAPQIYTSSTPYYTSSTQPLPELGRLRAISLLSETAGDLPPGTSFAMSEYGMPGAQAPAITILDPLGLNDPTFAHTGFSAAGFLGRQPDLIWMPHPDYTRIVSSILDSPAFWQQYDYYPTAFDYGFAIRKDRPEMRSVVEQAWRAAYGSLSMGEYLAHAVE